MMEWVKLGDVVNIRMGKTPSRKEPRYWNQGEYTWVSISDMNQKFISTSKETISKIAIDECNMRIIPKDTVIMSFKLSIGKRAITKADLYTNEAIASFEIIDDSILNTDYLYYALGHVDLLSYVNRAAKGKTLNKAILKIIEIPLFDMKTQHKIIEILDHAQALIDKQKAEIEEYDNLIQSIFYQMFGDLRINDKNWKILTFGDVSKVNQGLQIAIAERLNKEEENSYLYITTQYLNGGKNAEFIKNPKESVVCDVDDILVTRTGNTGKIVTGVKGVFHNNFFKLNYNENLLVKEFILRYLLTPNIQSEMLRRAATSTIPDLNHSEFYKISVPLPPLDIQSEFADKVNIIEKMREYSRKKLIEQETLFSALMDKAFKGELVK